MHIVATIPNSSGVVWAMDEEVGPNLVVVVYWNLPNNISENHSLVNLSIEHEAAEEFVEPLSWDEYGRQIGVCIQYHPLMAKVFTSHTEFVCRVLVRHTLEVESGGELVYVRHPPYLANPLECFWHGRQWVLF